MATDPANKHVDSQEVIKRYTIDCNDGAHFRKLAKYPDNRNITSEVVYKLEIRENDNKPFKIAAIVMKILPNKAKITSMEDLRRYPEYHTAMMKNLAEARTSPFHSFEINLRYPTDIVLACFEAPEPIVKGKQSIFNITVRRIRLSNAVKSGGILNSLFSGNRNREETERNRTARDVSGTNGETSGTPPPKPTDGAAKTGNEGPSFVTPAVVISSIAAVSLGVTAFIVP